MPYSLNNIPNYISNIPIGAQKLFIAAFNSSYKDNGGNEEKSRIAGWSNVKRKWKKQNGKWIKKTLSVELFGYINKYSDLTDDVLEFPISNFIHINIFFNNTPRFFSCNNNRIIIIYIMIIKMLPNF